MKCGVQLDGLRVGRHSLVAWWVVHNPNTANHRPTGVPLDVLLVHPRAVGSILLDSVLQSVKLALNPREHPIHERLAPPAASTELGPPVVDRIGVSPGARGTPPQRHRAPSSSACTSTHGLTCTNSTGLRVCARTPCRKCTMFR